MSDNSTKSEEIGAATFHKPVHPQLLRLFTVRAIPRLCLMDGKCQHALIGSIGTLNEGIPSSFPAVMNINHPFLQVILLPGMSVAKLEMEKCRR